jgi:Flp pilus assembly pilin Flp
MFGAFKAFVRDERGQATTEYILILAVVVMVALKFRQAYGTKLERIMQHTFEDIDGATQESGPN